MCSSSLKILFNLAFNLAWYFHLSHGFTTISSFAKYHRQPHQQQGSASIILNTPTTGTYYNPVTRTWVKPSKWDDLVDEDEEDDYDSQPVRPDMTYEPRNVKRAHETFLSIREVGGKEMTNDIYVRDPKEDVFWYAGKVARISDISLEQCVARQWPMIERHACNLRPIELFPKRGRLQIWTAPGDSELEVAYNRPSLQMTQMSKTVEGADKVKKMLVGFQGEIYQTGEEGFRTWRTDDGLPARPEINPGGETRPPTDEEYAQIQQELQGRDINDVYEEQERRKANNGGDS